jgi:hypothetical protein
MRMAPDLVLTSPPGHQCSLLASGTGALVRAAPRCGDTGTCDVGRAADLDGDGDDDVITWTRDFLRDGEVAVLTSRGDGADVARRFDVGPLPWSLATGDLMRWGARLAVSFQSHTGRRRRDAALRSRRRRIRLRQDLVTGIGPRCVVLADVDADGHLIRSRAFRLLEHRNYECWCCGGNGWFHCREPGSGLEPHALVAADSTPMAS